MRRKPWADQTGPIDSTLRRIQVRMTFLGMSQAALADRMGALCGSTVRAYLGGRRNWRRKPSDRRPGLQPIEAFAQALGVPVDSLEPGGPWWPLVVAPAHPEAFTDAACVS